MIAGIDIGSRSMELVVLEGEEITLSRRLPTTFDPRKQLVNLLEGVRPSHVVATGYGRQLAAGYGFDADVQTVTEIKAHARGAVHFFPEARAVLDIGGQDTKAIALGPNGRVLKFEMNDRCAAGTGKFLEHLANVFQIPVEEFGDYALAGEKCLTINSMCTVFAETEATSLMAGGEQPQSIALGLHASVVARTANMLRRVGGATPVVFAGGVARNPCMVRLMSEALEAVPLIPENPDMNGALGAALCAKL
ncbi:MAG: acyl-CoA dehydratase activase [Desulfovibrio sp.]|uniref:acyl-CoA dehydratase activase n=1 Tax=Desulfovibrio sp. 7SRBS1 TaxID=3378064 RepID=UPI003B4131BF